MFVSNSLLIGAAATVLAFAAVGCAENTSSPEEVVASTAPLKADNINKILCGVWEQDGPNNNSLTTPGGTSYPFGVNSVARVQFRKDGYATHFVAKAAEERAPCANPAGHLACTSSEAAASFYSALSLNYTYTATPTSDTAGTMSIAVAMSTYPNWTGKTLGRTYELADRNHLHIVTPVAPGVNATLALVRVAQCNQGPEDD